MNLNNIEEIDGNKTRIKCHNKKCIFTAKFKIETFSNQYLLLCRKCYNLLFGKRKGLDKSKQKTLI